jgi:dihydrofolate reductase
MYTPVHPYGIIWAQDQTGGIGKNNTIPWRNTPEGKADMRYFRETTTGCIIICGRLTAESFGHKLPNRTVIVVSSSVMPDGVVQAASLDQALQLADSLLGPEPTDKIKIWIAGGTRLYKEALSRADYTRLSITMIPGDYECDAKIQKNISWQAGLLTGVVCSRGLA